VKVINKLDVKINLKNLHHCRVDLASFILEMENQMDIASAYELIEDMQDALAEIKLFVQDQEQIVEVI
jgi:cell fate (sporulation/competence/biofilm development) regulator YlbF (YheA/YmcA/DUF963 family)